MSATIPVKDKKAKSYPGRGKDGASRDGAVARNSARGARSSEAGDVKPGNQGSQNIDSTSSSCARLLPIAALAAPTTAESDADPQRADRTTTARSRSTGDKINEASPSPTKCNHAQPNRQKAEDMSSVCDPLAATADLRVDIPSSSSSSLSSSSSSSSSTSPTVSAVVDSEEITASKVPAKALNVPTRTRLSLMLNPLKVLYNDWRGLAGEMGFEYEEIENFERERDPTKAVLSAWTCRAGSTIGSLLNMLQEIKRDDVLNEVKKLAERDASRWVERRKGDVYGPPVQDPEVSGSYPYVPETPELRGITLEDHPSGPPEVFDAYVCFTYADSEFVKEMMSVLEKDPYNLKLCIDFRDLVPGGSYSTITAELIENRCKRMIIILSPDFLVSEDCNFQTKFAHSIAPSARSKRLIPVMVESCQLPSILRHLTVCDYTKTDLRQWFWPRLYGALTRQ